MGISKAVALVCVSLIDIITLAMTVRAIISWFLDESNAIHSFFISITDPFIVPVRMLLNKLSVGGGMPIDLSFLVTFIILRVLEMILSAYFL